MSSFAGHSLTALAIFAKRHPRETNLCWLGCLMLAAVAPDLDYVLPFVNKAAHAGIRVSHSMAFACVVPGLVVMMLVASGSRGPALRRRAGELLLAGQSHIVLDFLVGVHPLPLFWPLTDIAFRCPIGLLPSAGALRLGNIYLWRNLALELGIFLPIIAILLMRERRASRVAPLLTLALICLANSATLPR